MEFKASLVLFLCLLFVLSKGKYDFPTDYDYDHENPDCKKDPDCPFFEKKHKDHHHHDHHDHPLHHPEKLCLSHKLIRKINKDDKTTFFASADQGWISTLTKRQVKGMLGSRFIENPEYSLPYGEQIYDLSDLPSHFDSRVNWPDCWTIQQIRDQSTCGSCWAFGAAEAISDRYCTYKVNANLSLSTYDILSCCSYCGDGCDGGEPTAAWKYWTTEGVVTEQCHGYPFPSCDHHINNSSHPCGPIKPTPTCNKTCSSDSAIDWSDDKHRGQSSRVIHGENDIMTEIYNNGPVETTFEVYEDFLAYKSGVYSHLHGDYLGNHCVKIIGWGIDDQTSLKYWLIANSWNTDWGEDGYFRILRGIDECSVEDQINCGIPLN